MNNDNESKKDFFCIRFELIINNNYKFKDKDCKVYKSCDDCVYKGVDSDWIVKGSNEIYKKRF